MQHLPYIWYKDLRHPTRPQLLCNDQQQAYNRFQPHPEYISLI